MQTTQDKPLTVDELLAEAKSRGGTLHEVGGFNPKASWEDSSKGGRILIRYQGTRMVKGDNGLFAVYDAALLAPSDGIAFVQGKEAKPVKVGIGEIVSLSASYLDTALAGSNVEAGSVFLITFLRMGEKVGKKNPPSILKIERVSDPLLKKG